MMSAMLEVLRLAAVPEGLRWLVDATLKVTVLLATAGIATLASRRASATTRHLVWSLAVLGALALPLFSLALPSWQLRILPHRAPTPQVEVAVEAPVVRPVLPHVLLQSRRAPVLAALAEPVTVSVASVAPVSFVAPKPVELVRTSRSVTGWQVLGGLWLAGALLSLAWVLVGALGVRWLARQARPVTDPAWRWYVDHLARRLGISRPVSLLESDRVSMPLTFGIRRPVVLVPSASSEWSSERRELVLLHELAHIRRLDALTQLAAQLTCAVYWFHPLAWIASRRMRALREYACDDHVLNAGIRASEYASEMLDMVRALGRKEQLAWATLGMARKSQLHGRLTAILDPCLHRAGLGRGRAGIVGFAALAIILPLAAVQPTAAAAPAQSTRGGPLPRLSQSESERRRTVESPTPATEASAPAASVAPAPAAEAAPSAPAAPAAPAARSAPAFPPFPPVPPVPPVPAVRPFPPVPPTPPAPPVLAQATTDGLACLADGKSRRNSMSRSDSGAPSLKAMLEGERCRVDFRVEGEITLTPDGNDVQSLSPNGLFVASQRGPDRNVKFEIRADRDGRLTRTWKVEREDRFLDADAQRWLAAALHELNRYAHLSTGGNAPVVAQVDRADARAYEQRVDQVKAEEAQARSAIEQAARESRSDHDLAEQLISIVSNNRLSGEVSRKAYVDAANRIGSDHDRSNVLRALIKGAPISAETGRQILESASVIGSDHELGRVLALLRAMNESDLLRGPLGQQYLGVTGKLGSDHERGRALRGLLDLGELPRDLKLAVLGTAGAIGSDHELAQVMRKFADEQKMDDELRAEYTKLAQKIGSEHERRRVLGALSDDRSASRDAEDRDEDGKDESDRDDGGRDEGWRADLRRVTEEARREAEQAMREAEAARREAERDEQQQLVEERQQRAEELRQRAEERRERARERAERQREKMARMLERAREATRNLQLRIGEDEADAPPFDFEFDFDRGNGN